MTPIADRLRMPFAAFRFRVRRVSLIPGVYIFRKASGLLNLIAPGRSPSPDLLLGHGRRRNGASDHRRDGFWLIVPELIIEFLFSRLADAKPAATE